MSAAQIKSMEFISNFMQTVRIYYLR